jgi:hypothetical protein
MEQSSVTQLHHAIDRLLEGGALPRDPYWGSLEIATHQLELGYSRCFSDASFRQSRSSVFKRSIISFNASSFLKLI